MKLVFATLAAAVALLGACTALRPSQDAPNTYVLDAKLAGRLQYAPRDVVLAVNAPRARPGFDTTQMAYERRPHEIEYYATNRWADTPARMLSPLLAQALEQSGAFRGVVPASSTAAADLRLDVEIVRLMQDFSTRPSSVRFTVRAQLIETGSRRVVTTGEFDESESAPSDDAYGGVIAANRALERLLARIAEFCAAIERSQTR